MLFRIIIHTDNAAFEDAPPLREVARILQRLGGQLGHEVTEQELLDGVPLWDANGNTVGRAQMLERE